MHSYSPHISDRSPQPLNTQLMRIKRNIFHSARNLLLISHLHISSCFSCVDRQSDQNNTVVFLLLLSFLGRWLDSGDRFFGGCI